MCHVEQAIVAVVFHCQYHNIATCVDNSLVFVVVAIGGQINMIHPNLAGLLNAERIAGFSKHLSDLDVSDDDVGLSEHAETNAI